MDGQDPIQRIEDLARRVKAGQGTPADVQILTSVRDQLTGSGAANTTATVAIINDALNSQQAVATDWTAQPEIAGTTPLPTAGSGGGGGGFSDLGLPPETPPQGGYGGWGSPFDALGALGRGAATTVNSVPDPVGAVISDPSQGSAFAQDNPWDIIGGNLATFGDRFRDLQGTNIPSANQPMGSNFQKPSVSDEGTLPPTQAPPTPDPVGAYQTAPNTAPLGTHMPGDLPPSGLGAEAATTDWRKERRLMREGGLTREEKRTKRALGGVDSLSTLPPDSAFAGVTDPTTVSYQPDMMARMIARKMTGGKDSAMVAGMILPDVETAMALIQSGQLGGGDRGSGLGPEITPIDQLQAIESYVTQMSGSTGTQVDPYAAYNEGLKRALHSSQDYLQEKATREDANAPVAARLASQIDTTQEALLSGQGGMTPGSYKKLKSRLDAAANEWLDLAMRSEPGTYVTYPQFLKERDAQTWFRRQE